VNSILAALPDVDVEAPDGKQWFDWGQEGSTYVAGLSPQALAIIVILIFSAILVWLVRRSQFLKGMILAAVIGLIIIVGFLK
jgi:hypothetical protein